MNRRWFEIDDSLSATHGRWYLDVALDSGGREIDPRLFLKGMRIEQVATSDSSKEPLAYRAEFARSVLEWSGALTIPLKHDGVPLDLTFGPFDMLVASSAVAQLFESLAKDSCQLIPAIVSGHSARYHIINVLSVIDCVDEARTTSFQQWAREDPLTDTPGKYLRIGELSLHLLAERVHAIDPSINLWRVKGFGGSLICSHVIKDALEANCVSGVRFIEVT